MYNEVPIHSSNRAKCPLLNISCHLLNDFFPFSSAYIYTLLHIWIEKYATLAPSCHIIILTKSHSLAATR